LLSFDADDGSEADIEPLLRDALRDGMGEMDGGDPVGDMTRNRVGEKEKERMNPAEERGVCH